MASTNEWVNADCNAPERVLFDQVLQAAMRTVFHQKSVTLVSTNHMVTSIFHHVLSGSWSKMRESTNSRDFDREVMIPKLRRVPKPSAVDRFDAQIVCDVSVSVSLDPKTDSALSALAQLADSDP